MERTPVQSSPSTMATQQEEQQSPLEAAVGHDQSTNGTASAGSPSPPRTLVRKRSMFSMSTPSTSSSSSDHSSSLSSAEEEEAKGVSDRQAGKTPACKAPVKGPLVGTTPSAVAVPNMLKSNAALATSSVSSRTSTTFRVTNTANNRNTPVPLPSQQQLNSTSASPRQMTKKSSSAMLFGESEDDSDGDEGTAATTTSSSTLDAGGDDPLCSPPPPSATAFASPPTAKLSSSSAIPSSNTRSHTLNGSGASLRGKVVQGGLGNSKGAQPQFQSRGLVEFASRPISAVESVIYHGSSDFTITGKQSAKMTIRGRPHHVTTILARANQTYSSSLPHQHLSPTSSGAQYHNQQAVAATNDALISGGAALTNDSMFVGSMIIGGGGGESSHVDPYNNNNNNSTNTSALGALSNSAMSFFGAGGTPTSTNSTLPPVTTTTTSTALPRHHILMTFGDEYEGEVVRVGNDWIPHGQGVLQSVAGQHCYVGSFKMKRREGRGKLATPRFVLWGEWKDNRPDPSHSARIDNCLTGERYRGNFRILTDHNMLTELTKAAAKREKEREKEKEKERKSSNPTSTATAGYGDEEVSKFSQWLQCSTVEFCKFGELVSQNGTRYFGEWYKGQQTGFGVQIFPNGDRYVGLFDMGLYHGNGAYFTYKRPRVCEECERRETAFESNESVLDVEQAQSLLLRAASLLKDGVSHGVSLSPAAPGSPRTVTCRHRTLTEVYDILVNGSLHQCAPHPHGSGSGIGGSGGAHEATCTYASTGYGAGGSQEKGFPNCGLSEKLTAMGKDGTVYDGIWDKGCFKGEGTHVTLPDRTRITADWRSVSKAENGHIFGPSIEEKSRKWQEHFHWEPLLAGGPQDRKDREYEALAPTRQRLRFCQDKTAFDTVISADITRGSRTVVNALKMFRRCFFASFGTCGAKDCIGAGGGVTQGGGGSSSVTSPTSSGAHSPAPSTLGSSPVGGDLGGGVSPSSSDAAPKLGWCKSHRTDFGGCIHLGKGRRITSTDVKNALTDIFSFVSSVQRFVEEMLEDDVEDAEEEDKKYFANKARLAELSNEGSFPNPFASVRNSVSLPSPPTPTGLISDGGASAALESSVTGTAVGGGGGNNSSTSAAAAIPMNSMSDRLFDSASEAYQEYEGVALVRRAVFDAVMADVHDILHNLYAHAYSSENRAVHVALQRLAGITLDDLGVSFGRHTADETLFDPYAEATRAIESITKVKSVSGKLRCLRQWSQAIDASTRLAQVKLLDEAERRAGGVEATAAPPKKPKAIESGSADDLLPIHQYVLLNARIPNLLIEVKVLLDVTADPHLIDVTSQDSFCITTLQACVSSIPQMSLSVRDESAVVTPCAMFSRRAEEALLSACGLPSDLVEYGYLRDAIAVLLGVLPEFPPLNLPLRMEGPTQFPLDTFDYCRSWVPTILNGLFFHINDSNVAESWRLWQEKYKHEEGRRKSSASSSPVVGGRSVLTAPPRMFVPFAAFDAGSYCSNSTLTNTNNINNNNYERLPLSALLLESIFGPFAAILSKGNGGPPTPRRSPSVSSSSSGCSDSDEDNSFPSTSPAPSRPSSLKSSQNSFVNGVRADYGVSTTSRIGVNSTVDDGSVESAIRIAAIREALYTQRKVGLDDTLRGAEELKSIAREPALWPPPIAANLSSSPSSQPIIGDSSGGGTANSSRSIAISKGGEGERGGGAGAAVVAESELSAIIRSLAPKPHVMSELYVEDADLLAFQIKNAMFSASLSPSGVASSSPSAKVSPFAQLNRGDLLVVWYLSLTAEERRVLRFAKKLLVAVRCLAAVNVHVCVDVTALPPVPPMFKRTVELSVGEARDAQGEGRVGSPLLSNASPSPNPPQSGALTRTSSIGLGATLPPTTTEAKGGDTTTSPRSPQFVSILDLFPAKLTKIEEVKALLSCGARLSVLISECYCEARAEAVGHDHNNGIGSAFQEKARAKGSSVLIGEPLEVQETSIGSRKDVDVVCAAAEKEEDSGDTDSCSSASSSEWSLDFASETDEQESAEEEVEEEEQKGCHKRAMLDREIAAKRARRAVVRFAFAKSLSRRFILQMSVVHDSSVYADAARALLRCDPREKN